MESLGVGSTVGFTNGNFTFTSVVLLRVAPWLDTNITLEHFPSDRQSST
jgi:hypothetical protein